nr:MAG TPA: hypothetical protein [Caudoviricetes sp.]
MIQYLCKMWYLFGDQNRPGAPTLGRFFYILT